MSRGTLLIDNARLVDVTGQGSVMEDSWLLCDGDEIVAVGDTGVPAPRLPSGAEVVDAHGAFVAPGFVSSHSHVFSSVARGLAAQERLYAWADAVYSITRTATPDQMYWATLHGALDALGAGVTSAFDFVDPRMTKVPMTDGSGSTGHFRDPAHVTRQIDAHRDSGLRSVLALRIEPDGRADNEVRRDYATVLERAATAGGAIAGPAVYGAAQWSDDPHQVELEAQAMRDHGLVNQAHIFETSELLALQSERFSWYDRYGALGPSMVVGHFIHPDVHARQRCVDSGTRMSWQPSANGRLGSGVADVLGLVEQGMVVGLGLDDQACSDISDPWQNMRMGLYTQRAHHGGPVLSVGHVLRMQTIDAARVIGIDHLVGSLEPGKKADFLIVDPRRPDVGPLWDSLASYVLACGTRNLESVWIGGRQVTGDGAAPHPSRDEMTAAIHGEFTERVWHERSTTVGK